MTQIFTVKDEVVLKFNSICLVDEQRGDMEAGFYISMKTDSSDIGVAIEAKMPIETEPKDIVYPKTYGEFKLLFPKHTFYLAQARIKIGEPEVAADAPTKD